MTPDVPTTIIGYARVSTDEQGEDGHGLDAQEQAITQAATARAWHLTGIVHEVGSGRSTHKRPLLHEAMRALDAGTGQRALVVAKLDRLTRSVADGSRIFERARKQGWDIVALDLGVDTTTAAGELVANVMMSVGQWERRTISERTRAGLAAAKSKGVKVGRPSAMPTATIRRLHELRAQGLSYERIAQALNAEGIPGAQNGQWWKASVYHAIRRYPPA